MGCYLITGVAGFIASRVAEFLLAQGHTVVGVDNLNDAYDVRLKHWRLDQLKGSPGFEFRFLDITDRQGLRRLMTHGPQPTFDAVIHLAAHAGVRYSVENPWVYFETNVIGALNLLELCREYAVEKFVLASSSSVYGAHNPPPLREDMVTDEPVSPYAASKKAAEVLSYSYHLLHGIDVTVLRYFTVYGPAGRPDMSLFRFVQRVHEERPLTVYGDGQQMRDFTYVDDITRGTVAGLRPLGYHVINLGCNEPVVLMDAILLLERLVGKEARLAFEPRHPADIEATWADIGIAERLLSWRPQMRLEEGMERLVDWYRANRDWVKTLR